jgi:ABC-type sugar transport system substrate-binding protein
VSALQRNKYDYFFSPWGASTDTLASGLRTAGVNGVKIASVTCDANDEANVVAGLEAVCVGPSYVLEGWMAVDTVLRHLEGMTIPPGDGGFPRPLLLTKQNSGDWKPGVSIDLPANYPDLFAQLWHVR